MTLADLIAQHWIRETSQTPAEWTPEAPSVGQCAITACLLHEICSLTVTRGWARLPDGRRISHYWNGGIDLTRKQFPAGTLLEPREGPQGRGAYSYALQNLETHHRLNLLRSAVLKDLRRMGIQPYQLDINMEFTLPPSAAPTEQAKALLKHSLLSA